jgi:hypothetical protein
MKRLLQSVALALVAFLAVQPALATLTCAQKICADGRTSMDCCLPSNDASMQDMANDPAMASMNAPGQAPSQISPAETACTSAPCCTVSEHFTQLLAGPVKSPVDGVVPFLRLGGLVATPAEDRTLAVFRDTAVPARDRPVLFQVFRI